MTNPNPIIQDAKRRAFLDALAKLGIVSAAARVAGVDRATAWRWRENDSEFAKAFDSAMQEAADAIEEEARRRAVDGVNEPVIYQGQPTYLFERDAKGELIFDTIIEEVEDKPGEKLKVKVRKPRYLLDEQGNPRVLTKKSYSDALLALVLKAHKPDRYRERSSMELTGADGGPVQITDTERVSKINALLAEAQRRKDESELL